MEISSTLKKTLPSWLIWGFIIVSFVGFIDSTYLTIEHYRGSSVDCFVSTGCDTVTTSEYSIVFGIPLALLGVLYYLTVFFTAILYADTKNKYLAYFLPLAVTAGLFCSVYFVYLQLWVLKAICEYCMVSAIGSAILFIFGMITLWKIKKA